MIYTLTCNPSLDHIVFVDNISRGALNRMKDDKIFYGGKGINISRVLKELGVESTLLGFSAGFTGTEIERALTEMGLKCDFVRLADGMTRINIKLKTFNRHGMDCNTSTIDVNETEINGSGPEVSSDDIEKMKEQIREIKADDILIMSGSLAKGMPADSLKQFVDELEEGTRVIFDLSGDALRSVLPLKPFLIKPNHLELGEFFNIDIESNDEDTVIFFAKKLKEMGAANVLVSMGKDGCVLVADDGRIYRQTAPQGQIINTVGSGDSMIAGFVAGISSEKYMNADPAVRSYEDAIHLAVAAGSATAFTADLANHDQIQTILRVMS